VYCIKTPFINSIIAFMRYNTVRYVHTAVYYIIQYYTVVRNKITIPVILYILLYYTYVSRWDTNWMLAMCQKTEKYLIFVSQ